MKLEKYFHDTTYTLNNVGGFEIIAHQTVFSSVPRYLTLQYQYLTKVWCIRMETSLKCIMNVKESNVGLCGIVNLLNLLLEKKCRIAIVENCMQFYNLLYEL